MTSSQLLLPEAAVGGVAAAAALAGVALSPEDLLDLALPLEGHPDNIAPALLGGLTVATLVEGRVRCVKLPVPDVLQAIAVIPDFRLSTAKARQALPPMVPRGDAVFNVGRAALFLAALQTARLDLLREGVKDRLHQPYRAPFVPGMSEVLAEGERAGALACFLSGAGPTLLALVAGDPGDGGRRRAQCWQEQAGVTARGTQFVATFERHLVAQAAFAFKRQNPKRDHHCPGSFAQRTSSGATPVPVPPPRPAMTKATPTPSQSSCNFAEYSLAMARPRSGSPPVPNPRNKLDSSVSLLAAEQDAREAASTFRATQEEAGRPALMICSTMFTPALPTPNTRKGMAVEG